MDYQQIFRKALADLQTGIFVFDCEGSVKEALSVPSHLKACKTLDAVLNKLRTHEQFYPGKVFYTEDFTSDLNIFELQCSTLSGGDLLLYLRKQDLPVPVITNNELVSKENDFLLMVSHDLGNPLRSIQTRVQFLKKELKKVDLSQSVCQHIASIDYLADKCRKLIFDLKRATFSPESNKESINLEDVVKQTVQQMQTVFPHKKVRLSCSGLPTLQTDRLYVNQLFYNLIANAIEHNPEEKCKIDIRGSYRDQRHYVEFIDDAGGVPEHKRDLLFSFYKNNESDNGKSTCLGLFLCNQMSKKLGGFITYHPTKNGSSFKVSFPDAINK